MYHSPLVTGFRKYKKIDANEETKKRSVSWCTSQNSPYVYNTENVSVLQ